MKKWGDDSMNRRLLLGSIGAAGIVALGTGGVRSANAQDNTSLDDLPEDVRSLLDPLLTAELVKLADLGPDTYYILIQSDEMGSGEPLFIRKASNAEAVIVEDATSLPFQLRLGLQRGDAADGTNTADLDIDDYSIKDADLQVFVATSDFAPSVDIDKRMHEQAVKNVGLNTRNSPGTNHGRLACAWSVNEITRRALGRPIGGGLATANMIKVLKARHARVAEAKVTPGSVVISPTVYSGRSANIGHVGIVGEGGKIYSNSSRRAKWEQNFSVASWKNYYEEKKGLGVQFFRLDGDYF